MLAFVNPTLVAPLVLIFIVMLLEYIRTFVGTGSFAVTDPLVT